VSPPGNAERRPLAKSGAPDQTIPHTKYTTRSPLPLGLALLVDTWPEEVVLTLRLHRALWRLVAALADCEV